MYTDDNISVFALPVVPSEILLQPANPQGEDGATLKRKREDSPERSSKQPLSQHSADQLGGDVTTTTESLRKAAFAPDFDPASLKGGLAQAWRQLVIQSMFPASQLRSAISDRKGSGKRQKTQKTTGHVLSTTTDATSTITRSPFQPKFSRLLPVPERALVGSSDPALKPTVAYAIVGPRIRGKFDGKKAVELGLPPGPLRARLVKGESVTVRVKDSNGKTVDRRIKPEDCIGESVTPAVSQVWHFF